MGPDQESLETGFLVADLGPLDLARTFEIFVLEVWVDKLDRKDDREMASDPHQHDGRSRDDFAISGDLRGGGI